MCDNRSTTVSNQSDSLCEQTDCELRKKGGVWICCLCEFGSKPSECNRYQHCASCNHEICEDCKEWTKDTTAEVTTAHEGDESSAEGSNNGSDAEQEVSADDASNAEDDGEDDSYAQGNDTSASGSVYSPKSNDSEDDSDD